MLFMNAIESITDPVGQLLDSESAVGLHHAPLAVHPLGFNGVQPRAFDREAADQHADSFACALHLLIMRANPGTNGLADVPRGVVPDQHPHPFTDDLQLMTAPLQELNGDSTDRATVHD